MCIIQRFQRPTAMSHFSATFSTIHCGSFGQRGKMSPTQKRCFWMFLIFLSLMMAGCVQSRDRIAQQPAGTHYTEGVEPGQVNKADAIKAEVFPEITSLLVDAQGDGAKKIAPLSYARAVQKLTSLDAFISVNPDEMEEIEIRAMDALSEAKRLSVIMAQCNRVKMMKPEEIVLLMEKHMLTVGDALGSQRLRSLHVTEQLETIVRDIKVLQQERSTLSGQVEKQQADCNELKVRFQEEIDTLNVQLAALKGQSVEDRMAKEKMAKDRLAMERRLEAEKVFNQQFLAVRSYFRVDEAEVLKQEYQLVIRLKAMRFPVGKSLILEENFELLGKVQKAIRTFENPRVIVEGHTDATGNEMSNMALSLQRAESVKQYLVANQTLVGETISAVGYGSQHPLASNNTAAGRAINRRIDVLIIPETKSM